MKERELREHADCSICHRGIGHDQSIVFHTVEVKSYVLNMNAMQRQQGLGMMIGAPLAMAMGPDEDLAKTYFDYKFTLCTECIARGASVAALIESTVNDDDDTENDDGT